MKSASALWLANCFQCSISRWAKLRAALVAARDSAPMSLSTWRQVLAATGGAAGGATSGARSGGVAHPARAIITRIIGKRWVTIKDMAQGLALRLIYWLKQVFATPAPSLHASSSAVKAPIDNPLCEIQFASLAAIGAGKIIQMV